MICIALSLSIWSFAVHADYQIDDSIYTDSYAYSPLHYSFWDNDYYGYFFRKHEMDTIETLSLSGTNKTCFKQLRWYYYNPSRWDVRRPLDQSSLDLLQTLGTWYDTMKVLWWLFRDCEWSWGDPYHVYGQLTHVSNGTSYHLLMGLNYDLTANTYLPVFSWSIHIDGQSYLWYGYLWDNFGGIASLSGITYTTDTTPPTFSFLNSSWNECEPWVVNISSATDTWAWLAASPYSFNGSTRGTASLLNISALQPRTVTRTWYVRDIAGNSKSHTATYTFNDVSITVHDFTGNNAVGSTGITVNRKTLSDVQEWSCWSSDIVYDLISSQANKWICSVLWDNLTYLPNADESWSDSCIIQVKDNENNVDNIQVYRWGINTMTIDSDTIILPNSDSPLVMIDALIASWYGDSTWLLSIRTELTGFLVGHKKISVKESKGKVLAPVILQSSWNIKKMETQIPEWTIVKRTNDGFYTWTLIVPEELSTNTIALPNTLYAARMGSTGERLTFVDDNQMSVSVTVRLPVPWWVDQTLVDIYASDDNGITWNYHTGTMITMIWWYPYVEFTTTHFTDFAVTLPGGPFTGSFTINNDAPSTSSPNVTLNISTTPAATQMRFQNDSDVWTRSDRVPYDTSLLWTLSAWYSTKTVYAQFDADGDGISDIETSDSISYSAPSQPWEWWSQTAQLHLEISGSSWYCTYGNLIEFGIKNFNYNAQTYSTGFLTTNGDAARYCDDTEGKSSRNMTIQSSTIVHSSNSSRNIPASRVFIKNPAATQINGSCTPYIGDSNNVRKPLSSPVTILGKTSDLGEICKIQTDSVAMEIDALANQAIGTYSWTLTLSIPLP